MSRSGPFLVRDLPPPGFEALAGLAPAKAPTRAASTQDRERVEAARRIEALEADLRVAHERASDLAKEARTAEERITAARRDLARLEAEAARARAAAGAAAEEATRLEGAVARLRGGA